MLTSRRGNGSKEKDCEVANVLYGFNEINV